MKPKRKGLNSTEARELMVLFSFYVVDILRIHRFIRAGASEVVVQDSYEWGGERPTNTQELGGSLP